MSGLETRLNVSWDYCTLHLSCDVVVGVVSYGSHLGVQYALVIEDSNHYTRSILNHNEGVFSRL